MKGYWIVFAGDVADPEAQAEYGRLWAPIGRRYGATAKLHGPESLYESNGSTRVIVVEFPSYAQAVTCYEDPEYQAARAVALRASTREISIIEGFPAA